MKERAQKIWNGNKISLLLVIAAMVLAACVELVYNISVLTASQKYGTKEAYDLADLKTEKMTQEGDTLVAGKKAGKIYLYPAGKYVDKLVYSYQKKDTASMLDVTVDVVTYDAYGNETTETITDANPYILDQSVVNIRMKAKEICISIPENSKGTVISNIYTKNEPQFVGMRWLFFASLFALVLLIWKMRNAFVGRAERIFLLIGLTAGTMMVIIMPLNKVGLDEEVHFRNAYDIKLSKGVSSTPAIEELKIVSLSNWPYNIAQSAEERDSMEDYYKKAGDYTKSGSTRITVPTSISFVGAYNYIFMALGIKIGKLLHLPFTAVYTLGRLFNMWCYVVVVYFAIKRLPIGKYIMAVLALMPTPMFQAGVYSYDSVVTGFMYLGLAYLVAELIEKDQKITIKNGVILLGSLSFGMLPKAVFVPVLALGFLLPDDKFKNKNQKRVFRITNVLCILGLLATFALPMLFATNSLGDVRGGNVNVGEQIALIVSHPMGYLKVWLTGMAETFWSYTFGQGALGSLGHLTASTCVPMLGLLMIFTIMTDNINRNEQDLTTKQKSVMFFAAALSVAFVWGAMYLSFNEVGKTMIDGVQGRYFIPLLFIFYLLLRRKQIKNTMNPVYYHYIVFGCSIFILYKTIYDSILYSCCF